MIAAVVHLFVGCLLMALAFIEFRLGKLKDQPQEKRHHEVLQAIYWVGGLVVLLTGGK